MLFSLLYSQHFNWCVLQVFYIELRIPRRTSKWTLNLIHRGKSVKLANIVEGDPKAPFSIATTPRCMGGHHSFPWFAPLYPWSLPYIAECEARRHQIPFLESLVWLHLGLNQDLRSHWRTLKPSCQCLV